MGIIRYTNPDEVVGPEETEIPDHITSCVTQDDTDIGALTQYISGPSWVVNYYRQVLGSDDPALPHDSNQPAAIQHYELIKDLEIKVTSPLPDVSTDTNTTITLEGGGLYLAGNAPNAGDMLHVSLTGGRSALFTVTNVNRRSYNLNTIYEITYILVVFTDTPSGKNELDTINNKVIRTFVYNPTTNGLVDTSQIGCVRDLYVLKEGLMNWYANLFIEKESNTLLLPKQEYRYFDNYLAEYIVTTTSVMTNPMLSNINILETNNDVCMRRPTFWSALKYRNSHLLHHCDSIMGQLDVGRIQSHRYTNMLRYGWIDYIIYPIENNPSLAHDNTCMTAEVLDIREVATYGRDLDHIFSNTQEQLIPLVTDDEFYVFSENFYRGSGEMTPFEGLVLEYIKTGNIDTTLLIKIAETYMDWGLLEQFYYIPILNTLIGRV